MPDLLIHQALHGYVDGHRQLSISTELKPQDSKLLMTLSDSSGSGICFPEEGYLTGYPLIDSGYYVLARTWPAPEMPRPGCVWTHSLLIDFADLATLTNAGALIKFFRRPTQKNFGTYNSAKTYSAKGSDETGLGSLLGAERLLSALYDKPKSRILFSSVDELVEPMVLAIWSQQWPRLRRSFRFCTCAAADRSLRSVSFDLQILPEDARTIRSRFSELFDANLMKTQSSSWLDNALQDLAHPNHDGLRTFLRQVGADVPSGREAFSTLCHLNALLLLGSRDALSEAIQIFNSQFSATQGRAARNAIIRGVLKHIQKLDEVTLGFLIDNLDSVISNADEHEILNIGNALWNSAPQIFALLYEEGNSEKREMIERIIYHLSLEGINERIAQVPNLVGLIIQARPEIVREKDFWTQIGDTAYGALSSLSTNPSNVMAAIKGLILSGREDLILPVFRLLSIKQIGSVVMAMPRERVGFAWFAELAKYPAIVRELLCENSSFQRYSVVVLAGYMRPEEISASNERDPWFSTWLKAEGEIYRDEQAYFFAFLMCRALSNDLNVSTEVIIHTFHALHFALEQNYMPGQAWELLNWRLPYMAFDSDRSAKLRAGVVSKFVYQNLSPYAFFALTTDESLFAQIAKLATNSSRGRRYLRNVLQSVKESLHQDNAGRYKILKDLL